MNYGKIFCNFVLYLKQMDFLGTFYSYFFVYCVQKFLWAIAWVYSKLKAEKPTARKSEVNNAQ